VTAAATPANDLDELWGRILEAVGRASPFTRSYLLEAHPVSLQGGVLVIGFDPEFVDHLDLVDTPKNRTLIQTKLKELGGGEVQVKFVKSEAPARRPSSAPPAPGPVPTAPPPRPAAPPAGTATSAPKAKTEPTPLSQDDFKNDPLIRKALETFKGQIVDVRA
jgi:DNA polymerase-3 subunit gamma/tau